MRPRRLSRPRQQPTLVIVLPIEGTPLVYLSACTLGDERRLRRWLRRQHELEDLQRIVLGVLEVLDRLDDYDDDRDTAA